MITGLEKDRLDVTVLLPCYNEEQALPSVIKEIRSAMGGTRYSYEILVSDDRSTDKSASVAEDLGCRVIHSPSKRGSGSARKKGILGAKGEIIVMMDADGSYTASDIPKMLEYFPQYEQVNGARTSEKGEYVLLRLPAKWFIRMLASLLSWHRIPDLNTGLKAFRRDTMLQYLWAIPDGFSCVSSMTLAYLCNGHSVKYIPTESRKRIGKSKFHPFFDTFSYIVTVFRLIIYFGPLKGIIKPKNR
jgi:polyisoprenyl-phosphate glycosyltransferase